MRKKKHIIQIGERYGRLIVQKRGVIMIAKIRKWFCVCDCGGEKEVSGSHLVSGKTQSCGCLYLEARPFANRKHGESRKTSEYSSYAHMVSRCCNPNDPNYINYGAVGRTVCDRWLGDDGYANFLIDMGRMPDKGYSLDRIDNNKGYYPENCRWATRKEQSRNKSTNRWVTYKGETKVLKDWANDFGIFSSLLGDRINRHGVDAAIEHFKNRKTA